MAIGSTFFSLFHREEDKRAKSTRSARARWVFSHAGRFGDCWPRGRTPCHESFVIHTDLPAYVCAVHISHIEKSSFLRDGVHLVDADLTTAFRCMVPSMYLHKRNDDSDP